MSYVHCAIKLSLLKNFLFAFSSRFAINLYLFAVYVNDVDCSSTGRHVLLYADDIILIALSISQSEKLLHKVRK